MCWRNGWAGTPAGLSTSYQVHQYNSNNSLNFRYKKFWRGFVVLAERLGWHSSGTLDLVSGAPIKLQQQLKFQIQKIPVISDEASLYWRNGWAGTPAGLSPLCQVLQYNSNNSLNSRYKKAPSFLTRLRCVGGADGTRTRDPWRDRPVF